MRTLLHELSERWLGLLGILFLIVSFFPDKSALAFIAFALLVLDSFMYQLQEMHKDQTAFYGFMVKTNDPELYAEITSRHDGR